MDTRDAIAKAREMGLDLVEIAPTAKPPVCKLIDYGKFLYEQKKKVPRSKEKAGYGSGEGNQVSARN